jgi:hypothetical protein
LIGAITYKQYEREDKKMKSIHFSKIAKLSDIIHLIQKINFNSEASFIDVVGSIELYKKIYDEEYRTD